MSDLVSRQYLLDEYDRQHQGPPGGARKIIEEAPAAQPEIVRCKDCKYWREHKYARETKRYIPFCGFNAIYTKADDFCSKGMRRTG